MIFVIKDNDQVLMKEKSKFILIEKCQCLPVRKKIGRPYKLLKQVTSRINVLMMSRKIPFVGIRRSNKRNMCQPSRMKDSKEVEPCSFSMRYKETLLEPKRKKRIQSNNPRSDDSLEKFRTIHDIESNPGPKGSGWEDDPIVISDSEDDIEITYDITTADPPISNTMYNVHNSLVENFKIVINDPYNLIGQNERYKLTICNKIPVARLWKQLMRKPKVKIMHSLCMVRLKNMNLRRIGPITKYFIVKQNIRIRVCDISDMI